MHYGQVAAIIESKIHQALAAREIYHTIAQEPKVCCSCGDPSTGRNTLGLRVCDACLEQDRRKEEQKEARLQTEAEVEAKKRANKPESVYKRLKRHQDALWGRQCMDCLRALVRDTDLCDFCRRVHFTDTVWIARVTETNDLVYQKALARARRRVEREIKRVNPYRSLLHPHEKRCCDCGGLRERGGWQVKRCDRCKAIWDEGAKTRAKVQAQARVEAVKPVVKEVGKREAIDFLYEKDGRCRGCALSLPKKLLELDRIIPGNEGGRYVWGNIQLLCGSCNRIKGSRPQSYLERRLRELTKRGEL